jgi:hypothetical protein
VSVKSTLDYDLSGAAQLKYLGKPTIGKKVATGHSSATGQ